MFLNHPRKTSIPLHLNFANSRRLTPSPTATTCPITISLGEKKRSVSAPGTRRPTSAVPPEWTPVEIANFPPQLRRADLLIFLKGYNFSPNFVFPAAPQFTRLFRTTISASSPEEATRMVKELNGKILAGREISVRMVGHVPLNKQDVIHDLADKLKMSIITTAQAFHVHLADGPLEVRELVEGGTHFAFLQKRSPFAMYAIPGGQVVGAQDKVEWHFVAGGSTDSDIENGQYIPRLEALKNLLDEVVKQGVISRIWTENSESRELVAYAM